MNTYLNKKFVSTVTKFLKHNSINSILIAISGGQDSLCLIKLLEIFHVAHQPLLKITYIYIDHQWKKNKNNYQQIKHLINIIRGKKIAIYQIKQIIKSETKARNIRYQTIINHANKHKYQAIITAHTQTDKIETLLQQIIRGTSLNGITSLSEKRKFTKDIYIYRPLLSFTRQEIHWFCRKFYLPIWSDTTNYENKIQRNRLRNELIPYINKYFASNIESKLTSFINISMLENEYIKQNAIKLYLSSRHKLNLALNYKLINNQHIALQIRTLQIFFFII
uniref:tRNA(Ile)-lysidine synthase n=1 Tax=Dicranema revolutum TaxID=239144 RepID=A0A4D6WR74_9FLOR|nr:tRNA Ile-lysidine synthetase [Dicranema revolutum]